MKGVSASPLNVKTVDGVLYMHQIVKTPFGVAQVQVAVNQAKVQETVRRLAQRAGVKVSGVNWARRSRNLAKVTAVRGGVELAALCGALPLKSLTKTVSKAARGASVEVDDEDDEDDDEDGDEDEEDDAEGFSLRNLVKPHTILTDRLRRKRRGGGVAPAEEEAPEDEPPAAAGDFTHASPDDTNPPSTQPVDVQPGYQDIGPSTPNPAS